MSRLISLIVLALVSTTHAQEIVASPEGSVPPEAVDAHWATRLGIRVESVNRTFPLVDRVVLVPDVATYVDELFKWSPRGRWPVLIEDDRYAPLFIARFKPAQVIRRESVGELTGTTAAMRQLLESVVIRTWGSEPGVVDVSEAFARQRYVPAGVVITSHTDPAWTAAVALAAGRGQPLLWLDDAFGLPDDELGEAITLDLIDSVDALVDSTRYPHEALGDAIDTITICRDIAGRVQLDLPPEARVQNPAFEWRYPLATTDVLGRHADGGPRYAIVGWVFGSEIRSAYVAMCSLFLTREQVWLFNSYPHADNWAFYRVDEAEQLLNKAGFQTSAFRLEQTTYAGWRHLMPFGFPTDILTVNSKGNPDIFELHDGAIASAGDVPTLSKPLAVHFTHSWSMNAPADPGTIAGQWIDHGAYAYVGSVAEPLLAAFVPPVGLANRWVSYAPFLVSARHFNGPFSHAWKVNTYGDPLMLCPPPLEDSLERLEPGPREGEDVNEHIKTLLRESADDETGEVLAEAIRTLNLLGRYDVAVDAWTVARQRKVARPSARPALTALYHRHDVEEFMEAWAQMRGRDAAAIDMLWHLAAPQLDRTRDPELLNNLQSSIRPSQRGYDVAMIAPALARVFGTAHTRLIIRQQIDLAETEIAKQQLNEILNQLQLSISAPPGAERVYEPPIRE